MHVSTLVLVLDYVLKKLKLKEKNIFLFLTFFFSFYLFLVDYQVSIVRSVLSYILLKINKLLDLKISTIKVYILVLFIVLMINPFSILNTGFQYSYIISFSLVMFSKLIKGNYIKKLLIISTISNLVSLPITLFNNFSFNYLSIILNIFYVPFISIIVFPLSLCTIILKPLDGILLILINLLEKITININYLNTTIITGKPSYLVLALYYIIIYIIFINIKKSKSIIVIILFPIIIHLRNIQNKTILTVLDVNQGDSIVYYDKGYSVLIDCGALEYKTYSLQINNYLKSLGIKKINSVIITHGDYDHLGSMYELINLIKIDKVYFNNNQYNKNELILINKLKNKNIKYEKIKNICINNICSLNNLNLEENDSSIVLYIEKYNNKILLMGDSTELTEKEILKNYNLTNIDFIKIGHHGSNTSTSKSFINKIKPKNSLISVGKNNRYGHPNKDVLNTLKKSKIYRTDLDGSIEIKLNKNGYKIKTCPP